MIQALEGWQGPAVVAKLAVIVIFDDPGVAPLRPLQQRQSTRQAEGHPHRALVSGGDHRKPGLVGGLLTLADIHAVHVDRHRVQPQARLLQKLARMKIAWLFKPAQIPRSQQGAAHQIQRPPITNRDEYLFVAAADPP
ncbi:hypothetical protein COCAGNCG_03231 [Aeromonas dhakensis]